MRFSSLIGRIFGSRSRTPAGTATAATVPRPLPYRHITLDNWRSSSERVAYASELFKEPLFLDLVGMLSSVRAVPTGVLDPTTAAFLLGQRAGQDLVIGVLLSAATPYPKAPTDLPADYGADNVQALWDTDKEPDQT